MGSLSHLERRARDTSAARGAVVLLHGFGAEPEDLFPVAQELDPDERYDWFFPAAPISIPGLPYGAAWFPRTKWELQVALFGPYFADLASKDSDGLVEAAAEIDGLVGQLGVEWGRTVIGGFSQGAIVAVECAIAGHRPAGVAILSGTLMAEDRWRAAAENLAGLRAFQSHGAFDSLLDPDGAAKLREFLASAGVDVTYHEFSGGHEIPAEARAAFGVFLENTFPDG